MVYHTDLSLYVNDIVNAIPKLFSLLYADDTNLLYSDTNINSLYDVANIQLSKVCEWLQANRLSVNSKKCNFIIFSKKDKIPGIDESKMKVNNTEIARVDKTKFLGVFNDSRLSWKPHIHEVENKIEKKHRYNT